MSEQTPIQPRSAAVKAMTPINMLIYSAVGLLGLFGVIGMMGLSGNETGELVALLGLLVSGIQGLLNRQNDKRLVVETTARESKAHRDGLLKPQPQPRERVGDSEGGQLDQ